MKAWHGVTCIGSMGSSTLFSLIPKRYKQSWIKRGFDPAKLKILPRGLDTELFHPGRRDSAFFEKFGASNGELRLLYVGRISREKDLDLLADAYRRLRKEGLPVRLFVVGHGPYSEALAKSLPDAFFTGYLRGTELATAYASADIFVFPSTTDTFGNVILEAQASGLPVVVSDSGGPKELVAHKANGLITRSHNVEDFTDAIRALVTDQTLRRAHGELRSGQCYRPKLAARFRKILGRDRGLIHP